ncbi:DNA mismatch repair endonuclease MutL [Oculatella sp. LEGE 06141]|uniref:DNA mismatch repair endonuclease MutL n=1 Tax=Oculatella sp. LEGE 06141 TaxID=1828648 RepID=UPI00187FD5DE|nr:DNA mismatch repair endonuclease MutL [Oculatella sp. LEGE 06141]MBE9182573.1 DNA mismatch repair endonuclease MutL [Oculatella sp. LEGE 06141]
MTASIQALPTEIVHLIAAGEVIDSVAAVVRELAENALDAGATRITVSLLPDQWRIRVADNGTGMDRANLEQAAAPHSTSKIRSEVDLGRINSLGFRGEALHSLVQLATLEICSRTATADEGWQVRYNAQGTLEQTETVAIAPGTIVTVSHLFSNLPTRRQGLPSLAQQLKAVQVTIQHLALCHPQVTWLVEQNDREWFAIWAGDTAQHILPQLLREVQISDLAVETRFLQPNLAATPNGTITSYFSVPTDSSTLNPSPPNSLYLVLGLPDRCHRHRPDWIKVAINGRVVKVPELEQTILGGFRRTLPRDRYPVCFVHLQVSPDQIDWNRHPAKAEIYLHHMGDWQDQVKQAIEQALRLSAADLSSTGYASERVEHLLKTAESQGVYRTSRSIQPVNPEDDSTSDGSDSTSPSDPVAPPSLLKAIAQVHQMYILVEHPGGMWLVEQHIAHERVLYEQLRDRWHLIDRNPPIILSQLSPMQVAQLERIGIAVEMFGDQLWAVRSVPAALNDRTDCADALIELSLGSDLESALVATACRTAIRNGTPLNLEAMQRLLEQWQQTQHPHTCPHGRPIYLSLEESRLSRFFRRHWVIGKSHGI